MRKATLAGALGLLLASMAAAAPINGSLPFAAFGVVLNNGTDLSNTTSLSDSSTPTSNTGAGDYSIVPINTDYGPFTLDLPTIGIGGGLSLSNVFWGSFVASSGTIVTQNASFLDVYLLGTYTPGPGFVGVDPDATSFRIDFTNSGSSISSSATLSSPPAAITPEPATMTLIGAALVGLAGLRRRKA